MPQAAFTITWPKRRSTSVVFASPHSGHRYSSFFLAASALDKLTIRSSEDAFVDVLFGAAPHFGAPLLLACAPRAYVDLNRSAEELDPALIEGVAKNKSNPRVSSGLGVIPRVVANGKAIYQGKISRQEADQRLKAYWHPYHDALQTLLDESHRLFGEAILVDCHSMPHEAISSLGHGRAERPDIVLGDRFGASASARVMDRIETVFKATGLSVARNSPFAGAYTAQHYGRPSRAQHVVQIEIDRSLYMNERKIQPNANFDEVKALMTQVVAEVSVFGRGETRLAAE